MPEFCTEESVRKTIYVTDKGELKLTDFCISGVRTINTELKTEIFPGYARLNSIQLQAVRERGQMYTVSVLYCTGYLPVQNLILQISGLKEIICILLRSLIQIYQKHVSDVIMDGMNILGEDRIPTITELVTRLFDQPVCRIQQDSDIVAFT